MFKIKYIFNKKKNINFIFFLKNFCLIKNNKLFYYKFLKNLNFLKISNLNFLNKKKIKFFLYFFLILKKKNKLKLLKFKIIFKTIKSEQIKYKLFKLILNNFIKKKIFIFENNIFKKISKYLNFKKLSLYNIKKIINLKKFKNYNINLYKNKYKQIFNFKKKLYINNILKLNNLCLLKNFINNILLKKIKFDKILINNK
ncbi:hypothetical protein [Candidatus Nasuia deltocephalinicola]|uniref:hypothetical protein n=1 Tax=Candidatus Nasuia deltocephalincola TaxID=1160784 RepID=UPI00216B04EF|nr:hypothetical protein [Candidatus Nasuia deltocephalinicola]